jgi:orotate phosphoribosyltransferase
VDTRARLKRLIEERCVLRGDFLLASGQRAGVYFDGKRATLDPEGVHLIATLILELTDRLSSDDGRPIDAVGGPTIGADPVVGHVAGLSWQRAQAAAAVRSSAPAGSHAGPAASGAIAGRPAPAPRPLRAFLVRKESKEHGTRRLIENDIPSGSRVLVFEDVVTTGGSTLAAIKKIEEAGLEVAAVAALVDREQGGAEALSRYRYHPFFRKSEFGI